MKHLTKQISENLFLLLQKSHFPLKEYPITYGDVIDWLYDNNLYPVFSANKIRGELKFFCRIKDYQQDTEHTVWNGVDIEFPTIDDCIEKCIIDALRL